MGSEKILESLAAAKRKEGSRCEIGVFQSSFEVDGKEVIRAGQKVLIADAVPGENESAEDVAGYCDVINESGAHIAQGIWSEFEGLYEVSSDSAIDT